MTTLTAIMVRDDPTSQVIVVEKKLPTFADVDGSQVARLNAGAEQCRNEKHQRGPACYLSAEVLTRSVRLSTA